MSRGTDAFRSQTTTTTILRASTHETRLASFASARLLRKQDDLSESRARDQAPFYPRSMFREAGVHPTSEGYPAEKLRGTKSERITLLLFPFSLKLRNHQALLIEFVFSGETWYCLEKKANIPLVQRRIFRADQLPVLILLDGNVQVEFSPTIREKRILRS